MNFLVENFDGSGINSSSLTVINNIIFVAQY